MYENFYHLRAKPFRLSPDPSFFFASRGHKRALAYLRYGLSQSEGFVVITGAPGTGKTTLAQILLQEMGQSDVVVAHLTTTQLEADEMLRMVLASFGLRYEGQDKAGMLKTLEAFFMARSRERKRVLLVVDEAQNLPARSLEELRMLSNLQVGDKALLQTFLLGQVQFRQMLDHPDLEQLRQRVIANYHLSALGEDECQSYVESRMKQVGWANDPQFTDEAFQIIYEYTEGVPRRINMLCDRVLLFSSLEEQHEINADVLRDVTDELQSEISGRPIKAQTAEVEALLDEPMSEAAHPPLEEIEAQEPIAEASPAEKTKAPEKTKKTKPAAPQKTESRSIETDETPAVASTELDSPTEPPVVDPVPDNGGLDRAMPDDGWMQHVAQAQPDETIGDDASHNNEPAELERFRVIAGGRETEKTDSTTAESRPANQPTTEFTAPLPDVPGDSAEVVLRKILRLVLAFHRSPRSFPGLDDPFQPLPKGITAILELAVADDQVLSSLRQIAVMGISPSMLRAAVRFFVRRVLFLPGGDDYRVLGLPTGAELSEVEVHYNLLMRLLRQDKKASDESGVLRVGEAYERLCSSEITSQPEETEEEDELAAELETVDDVQVEDELDLDLSPNLGNGSQSNMRPAQDLDSAGGIAINNVRTAPTARNMMLIAGAAVIVFLLYLTQIKTNEQPVPEPVVEAKSESVVAPVVVTEEDEAIANGTLQAEIQPAQVELQAQVEEAQPAVQEKTQAELEAEAKAEAVFQAAAAAKQQLEAELKAREEAEAKAAAEMKAAEEALAVAEAKAAAEAEAKASAEAAAREKAKAEAEARKIAQAKAEAEARAKAQAKAKAEAKAKAAAKTKAEAEARVKALIEKKATEANAAAAASGISAQALEKLQSQFITAFAAGDLNTLLGLHSEVVRTDKHSSLSGVRSDFEKLFAESGERSLQFKNLNWERKSSYARGVGQYEQSVVGKGGAPSYTETGDITLQVENRSGKLEILRYYESNAVVKQVAKQQPKAATAEPAASTSVNQFTRIPKAELEAVLARLASLYSKGDIDAFMTLFAKDAQTNDRATVAGIREDYAGLFSNTSYRNLALQDMKWRWDGQVARGEGDYDVLVQPNGKDKRDHYQGQIWIQVERRDGVSLITHFAFSE